MVWVWQNQQKQLCPKTKHYHSIILNIGHSSSLSGGIMWKEALVINI